MAPEELQEIAETIADLARNNYEAYGEMYAGKTEAFDHAWDNMSQDYGLSAKDSETVGVMADRILSAQRWWFDD